MRSWQVQEAKARFSHLLRDAAETGPQQITVRGRAAAVVLSAGDYERLCNRDGSFVEFLRRSPLVGLDLDLDRNPSAPRDIEI